MIGREERLVFLYVIDHPITINTPEDRIFRKIGNQKAIYHAEWLLDIRTINRDLSVCNEFLIENTFPDAYIEDFAIT